MIAHGGAAAAAAIAASQTRQLLVGGLLIELAADDFVDLARQVPKLVLTGKTQGFWQEGVRQRWPYPLPYANLTSSCKRSPEEMLDLEYAIEYNVIRLGPLARLL